MSVQVMGAPLGAQLPASTGLNRSALLALLQQGPQHPQQPPAWQQSGLEAWAGPVSGQLEKPAQAACVDPASIFFMLWHAAYSSRSNSLFSSARRLQAYNACACVMCSMYCCSQLDRQRTLRYELRTQNDRCHSCAPLLQAAHLAATAQPLLRTTDQAEHIAGVPSCCRQG